MIPNIKIHKEYLSPEWTKVKRMQMTYAMSYFENMDTSITKRKKFWV